MSKVESKKSEYFINKDTIKLEAPWIPVDIGDVDSIPKGDMPGDEIKIGQQQLEKAQAVFPKLLEILLPILNEHPWHRTIIGVCGGSGVGKSEMASLLSYYLNKLNIGSYTLSGDNYPHRIPMYNDAERLRIYRQQGINGLISGGQYLENRYQKLKELQIEGNDSNPDYVKSYPWLSVYQNAGRNGLKNYLGTTNEIDFNEINGIITQFKNGAENIFLKRMGRSETDIWYEGVDFRQIRVMIIEWTHANSNFLQGVDIPILLNSTPKETLEHRKARNRDGGVDSSFTTVVLNVEQEMLVSQSSKAKLILSKNGELLTYSQYLQLMLQEG
jgi:alpha-galactosidase